MGQSQSSHATDNDSLRNKAPDSVRGRKSVSKKIVKSPHGLRASVVSEPSVPDFEETEHCEDHTSVVLEESEEEEDSVMTETESEEEGKLQPTWN